MDFPKSYSWVSDLIEKCSLHLAYLARIADVYILRRKRGPLSFWHENPELNERAFSEEIGEYYMVFDGKADYRGPFDQKGVPLLDYMGDIGRQYYPIAIAQYGLASYNRYLRNREAKWHGAFLNSADWLVENLQPNRHGIHVWYAHFDWAYRQTLMAPWYSGLAQGQGLSLLIRAAVETNKKKYEKAAVLAFESFEKDVKEGGVVVRDEKQYLWIEEYLVDDPPTHVLNGFIWALWGICDYWKWKDDPKAGRIYEECIRTLEHNLGLFDTGYWSTYEVSPSCRPMLASHYYHRLHITELRVLYRLTGCAVFRERAEKWESYERNYFSRYSVLLRKAWFKLWNY